VLFLLSSSLNISGKLATLLKGSWIARSVATFVRT